MSGISRLVGYMERDASYYGHVAGGPGEVDRFGTSRDATPRRPAGRTERTLGESHGHRCVIGRDMEVFDIAPPPHGRWYVGKAQSDSDALSKWRGWLRSQGVVA
jgi:hypothetical protein